MEDDPKVIVMGEDVGKLGGVFRVTDGLQKDFGDHRVLDTPLAESGIIGTAVGLAMRGYRPVTEIQFDGFVFPGLRPDHLAGRQDHLPDAGRLVDADGDPDPVRRRHRRGRASRRVAGIVLLPHRRAAGGGLLDRAGRLRHAPGGDRLRRPGGVLRAQAPVLGEGLARHRSCNPRRPASGRRSPSRSVVRRPGTDVTVVSYGPSMPILFAAADAAAAEGRSLEVIDLRSLSPLDLGPVLESVRRTGRLVVVSEAPLESSITANIAARVTEEAFYSLAAPVLRVAGFDTPYPPSRLEDEYLPDLDKVLDAVDRALAY